ncbi:MAG: MamK family actin-like protein [Desulfuromonadales bacterium]
MGNPRILKVGIDLGNSMSVIATENGVRACVPSYVGFPKDMIARKLLGKEVLYGSEAVKHRLSCNVFRPLELGVLKHSDQIKENPDGYQQTIKVAKLLLKHLIDLVTKGRPEDYIIHAVIGAPALASENNKQGLLDISEGILEKVQIASEPFTVAYGMNLLNNALIIDIGAGTVDLCRMQGLFPTREDQLTTYKAGDFIDNVFFDLIEAKYPDANYTLNMLKKFKEEHAIIANNAEKLYLTLPVNGKPTALDVTEEMRQACRAIVPEITAGIKYLVSTYDPEFQAELKENIILAGGGSQITGLCEELEKYMLETLGYGSVKKHSDPVYAGADGALMYCKDLPEDVWNETKQTAKK